MTFARNGASPNGHAPKQLDHEWETGARWQGVLRSYTAEEVLRLRGPVLVEHTLARLGAERLWRLLATEDYVAALGGMTGGQAVQMAKAGLKAIYLSGWQVAADANLAGQTYPDQSLYPADSAPALVRRLNNALLRAGGRCSAAARAPARCPPGRGSDPDTSARPDSRRRPPATPKGRSPSGPPSPSAPLARRSSRPARRRSPPSRASARAVRHPGGQVCARRAPDRGAGGLPRPCRNVGRPATSRRSPTHGRAVSARGRSARRRCGRRSSRPPSRCRGRARRSPGTCTPQALPSSESARCSRAARTRPPQARLLQRGQWIPSTASWDPSAARL